MSVCRENSINSYFCGVFMVDLSAMTVAEIRQMVRESGCSVGEKLLKALSADPRAGVKAIYRILERQRQCFEKEQKRLDALYLYENQLTDQGVKAVAGVDEAGRGPLAGPVTAAAVILPLGTRIPDLNDSKKLTPEKRNSLAMIIRKVSKAWAVGIATVEEIEQLNIYQASLLAMRRAVEGLEQKPQHVLVDGFAIPGFNLPQTAIIGGDAKSASIAAASILAKVARDDVMDSVHHLYPQYGFDCHKGYATPEHLKALRMYGPCPLHRRGFSPVKDCEV